MSTDAPPDCVDAFDRIWYCYTPVHQFTHLYQQGTHDSCYELLRSWFQCMALKLKKPEDAVRIVRERQSQLELAKPTHIWTFRTEPPPLFRAPASHATGEAGAAPSSSS